MQSKAKTVAIYLKEFSPERRTIIASVRKIILKNLPEGYKEVMQYGMIGYVVPLALYPGGYLNDKKTPLPYIALASQKNHLAIYFMNLYGSRPAFKKFQAIYKKSGKKLNMGKSCLRFKRYGDLSIEAVKFAVALTPVKSHIAIYEKSRKKNR